MLIWVKESINVVNRDWVNHQACSQSHDIRHVVSDSFITNDYVSKLARPIYIVIINNLLIVTMKSYLIFIFTEK